MKDIYTEIKQPFLCGRIKNTLDILYDHLIEYQRTNDKIYEEILQNTSFMIWFLRGEVIPSPKDLIDSLERILLDLKEKIIVKSLQDLEVFKEAIHSLEVHVLELKLCLL